MTSWGHLIMVFLWEMLFATYVLFSLFHLAVLCTLGAPCPWPGRKQALQTVQLRTILKDKWS